MGWEKHINQLYSTLQKLGIKISLGSDSGSTFNVGDFVQYSSGRLGTILSIDSSGMINIITVSGKVQNIEPQNVYKSNFREDELRSMLDKLDELDDNGVKKFERLLLERVSSIENAKSEAIILKMLSSIMYPLWVRYREYFTPRVFNERFCEKVLNTLCQSNFISTESNEIYSGIIFPHWIVMEIGSRVYSSIDFRQRYRSSIPGMIVFADASASIE